MLQSGNGDPEIEKGRTSDREASDEFVVLKIETNQRKGTQASVEKQVGVLCWTDSPWNCIRIRRRIHSCEKNSTETDDGENVRFGFETVQREGNTDAKVREESERKIERTIMVYRKQNIEAPKVHSR